MSFILDALRKSETERQRQSGPGLVDAGYRPPAQRRPIWLPVLVTVLGANLVVMGFFWLRREAAPPATVEPPAAANPAAGASSEPGAGPVAGSPAATAGAPVPAEAEYEATADLPAVEGEPVTEVLEPPPVQAAPPAAAPAVAEPTRHVTDDLPSATQLMASGAIPTQELHLDIHVYSNLPSERFVFINMRKYAEGAQLALGVRVEQITPDGVVLSQDGQRFVLNRD